MWSVSRLPRILRLHGLAPHDTFVDHLNGLSEVKNREMYREELNRGDEGYGVNGRIYTDHLKFGYIMRSIEQGASAFAQRFDYVTSRNILMV
jgi:hypothetical protein